MALTRRLVQARITTPGPATVKLPGAVLEFDFSPQETVHIGRWLDDDGMELSNHDEVFGTFMLEYQRPEGGPWRETGSRGDKGEKVWWMAPEGLDPNQASYLFDTAMNILDGDMQVGSLILRIGDRVIERGPIEEHVEAWDDLLKEMFTELIRPSDLLTPADRIMHSAQAAQQTPASLMLDP